MILLDANVIIRFLVAPADSYQFQMQSVAKDLFQRVAAGHVEVMITDMVLAEVAFSLTSPRQYGIEVADACLAFKALVEQRNVRVADRNTLLHALELWSSRPKLGFVDAMTAAQAQRLNVQFLTFDSDFDGIEGIDRWSPEDPQEQD